MAGDSHFSWSFLLAVFISNFPEALSSSVGMKQAGTQTRQILGLWIGVVVLSGLCAGGSGIYGSASNDGGISNEIMPSPRL